MDDLGSGTVRKDFGFYLVDGSNVRLHPLDKKYEPTGVGVSFIKDYVTFCKGLVSTVFPTDNISAQTDSNIIKEIKLKYGEIAFDSSTCISTPTINTTSASVYVLNANITADMLPLFGNSSGFTSPRTGLLLSQRPYTWTTRKGCKDYLWFLGVGSITINYYNGTTLLGAPVVHTLTNAFTVKYICLEPVLNGFTGNVTSYTITVNDGVDGVFMTAIIQSCAPKNDYHGVLFLEPLGGRAMMPTGMATEFEVDRKGQEITKQFNISASQVKSGSRTMITDTANRTRTFKTELLNSPGVIRFIENFFSSPGHHLQKGNGNTATWEKFMLDTGSFKVYEKDSLLEIEFSGNTTEGLNNQGEDI